MTLYERIETETKDAMRAKDTVRLDTLRMLKSQVKYLLLEKNTETPTDADVLAVVQKEVKKRRDSIEAYEKGARPDLAAKEKAELAILTAYLPQQLSPSELEEIVKAAIAEVGAVGKADMGKVMKVVVPKIAGRADGKILSQLVQSKLS